MNHSQKYLAKAQDKLGITEGKQLAEALDCSPAAICQYQSGERIMNDTTASKIAEVLAIPAIEIIAAANADREKGKNKDYWENFYKRLGGVAASLAVISITALPSLTALSKHCILCKIKGVIM